MGKKEILISFLITLLSYKCLAQVDTSISNSRDSIHTMYHENGKIKETGFSKNGIRTGLWKKYDINGSLIEEGNYSGKVNLRSKEVKLKNGDYVTIEEKEYIKEGYWKFYNRKGKLIRTTLYRDGKKAK